MLWLIIGADWWGIMMGREEANQLSISWIIKHFSWSKGEASCTQESLNVTPATKLFFVIK